MQKIRNRLVNFRVTEEEFEQLKSASDRQGARCLSHFVRDVMLSNPNFDPESVVTKVVTLDRRITELETRFPSNVVRSNDNDKEVPPCV